MLTFNSALLASAAEFTGRYAPYQGVELRPAGDKGVFVSATDKGNVAFMAFDPNGIGDETIVVLPDAELTKSCKGLKTAEREIRIDGATALVTTFRKSTSNEAKEIPITRSSVEFPPLARIMRQCVERWGMAPAVTASAGRYDNQYIEKAMKALAAYEDSVVMSCFDGGPLRLQGDIGNVTILVMPQTAAPVPQQPAWLSQYAM